MLTSTEGLVLLKENEDKKQEIARAKEERLRKEENRKRKKLREKAREKKEKESCCGKKRIDTEKHQC